LFFKIVTCQKIKLYEKLILISVGLFVSAVFLFPQELPNGSPLEEFFVNTKFISIIDVYYSYDFATNQNPKANERRLAASAPFNNEFRLNYFSFELQHSGSDFRAAGGLHRYKVFVIKSTVQRFPINLGLYNKSFFSLTNRFIR
jgi:hypothetical protein